jgi:ABC-type multidrug transport system fused ATPase/permease subunit
MLKRINVSIFQPSKIAFFLKDKLSYIFLYIALLSLMASFPMILSLSLSNQMPKTIKDELTSAFIRADISCQITNGVLEPCATESFTYQTIVFKTNSEPAQQVYQIIFEREGLTFYYDTLALKTYRYDDLNMTNINLNMASEADQAVFSEATDLFYNDLKPYFVISGSTIIVGANIILYVALALIMAFFYGLRPEKLKFKFRFMMATYALTSYFVLVLIGELYGLGLLSYVALIMPYIYMGIAFRGLLRMSKIVVVRDSKQQSSDKEDESEDDHDKKEE